MIKPGYEIQKGLTTKKKEKICLSHWEIYVISLMLSFSQEIYIRGTPCKYFVSLQTSFSLVVVQKKSPYRESDH